MAMLPVFPPLSTQARARAIISGGRVVTTTALILTGSIKPPGYSKSRSTASRRERARDGGV
jgi:hypothetical protein